SNDSHATAIHPLSLHDALPICLVDLAKLQAALRADTILVSVLFVNNEIGVIQDIETIGKMCRERGIIFHVDAAQATGKVDIDLADRKSTRLNSSHVAISYAVFC